MFAIEFDHLARMDEHYPEHRARHDRRKKLSLAPRVVKATDDPRGTRYGIVAMRNIIARLAEREDRNNALFAASCQIGELVAGGQIDGSFATACLEEAIDCISDEPRKSRDTAARGLARGLANPRVPRKAA